MKVPCRKEEMERILNYVEKELKKYKLDKHDSIMTMLMVEESIVSLIQHAPKESELEIKFQKKLGDVNLTVCAQGEAFDISESRAVFGNMELDDVDESTENAIRGLLFRSQADRIRYKNNAHKNTIQITVKRSDRKQLYFTLAALGAAVVLGGVFKILLPKAVQLALNEYIFSPVKTMFLNALKMIIGPVVFFSIVSCLSQFDSLRDLGKIGAKVMGMYLFTTFLAILVGLGVFFIIQPGNAALAGFVTDAAKSTIETANETNISILDTIINIVPSNFVKPFLEGNMLQIIFMAIICGVAVGMIGDYSKPLKDFFEACNMLFLKITTLIVKVIPLAVLCSITSLVMLTGTDMLAAIMSFVGTFLLALAVMVCVYCILVLIIGRLNPLKLVKKHAPTMLTNFSLASSNAAMPFNIESCKRLGISSKVCAFSIPLGATVNMDGSCIYMVVAGLFLAKVFGVEMDHTALFSMIFSVVVLSIGAPGIPGSGLVCLSVLLVQLGIPTEALSLIIGIDSMMGMFRTAVNSTGDVAVSLIVAKTEHLLDNQKYHTG
ncbi:MAG: cation:dicarboxylate symporter family transporter [Lachnospiraceae bacterium]